MFVSRISPRRAVVPLLATALAVGSLSQATPARAQVIRPDFWGMHASDWQESARPSVPVGSANLTTASTYWTSIEPTPGSYNWTRLDEQVAGAEAVGAQPMIVLGRTPQHASPRPGSADFADYMPPIAAWKGWVTEVVQRYGSRLDYQIWPEPNIIENWKGSPRQMAELTAAASSVIHKYAPGAKVVAPALALRLKAQRAWMVDFFRQSVGGKRVHNYIDAVAIDPFPVETGTPEDSFSLMQAARRSLARIGVRKPIWNNEINYGVEGGFAITDTRYPVDVQQSFVIRTYALSAAARMQRTYWLSWFFGRNTMGVEMSDAGGSALQPATSYGVVRAWLNGTRFVGCSRKASGLWVCTATSGSAEVRRIYWKPGRGAVITTPRSTLRVENQEGGVDTRRGSRRITVNYRPIMVASRR